MEKHCSLSGINLELTTCCPLRCPQCYCTLEGGRHLELETAKRKLKEAGEHGVELVHLSGGETMCYPHLYEVIAYAAEQCKNVHVALSGYRFDAGVLSRLVSAGVSGIFLSLNGSTREINSLTRDGYDLAIHALEVLQKSRYPNTYINWVMHSSNCGDFRSVVRLAERYGVSSLVVLSFKPDARHQLKSYPSGEQIAALAEQIKAYRGPVRLMVETCFSPLLAVLKDTRLFGNLNVGPAKGCRAGLYNYSINIDGQYSPCRHLDLFEDYETVDDYLAHSETIARLRTVEEDKREPCRSCYYGENCRPCMAVSSKLHGGLFMGHQECTLWKTRAARKNP